VGRCEPLVSHRARRQLREGAQGRPHRAQAHARPAQGEPSSPAACAPARPRRPPRTPPEASPSAGSPWRCRRARKARHGCRRAPVVQRHHGGGCAGAVPRLDGGVSLDLLCAQAPADDAQRRRAPRSER
jgi:hypothetical protein